MKELRASHIVHIFAVVHAAIVLVCQAMSISDELVLTSATVAMIVILAMRMKQGLGIMAACIIAGNILGFIIGTYGANILSILVKHTAILHSVMSFITTEIIGLSLLLLFTSLDSHKHESSATYQRERGPRIGHILLIIGALLLMRIIYSKYLGDILTEEDVTSSLQLLFSNSLAIIVLVCFNLIYILITHRYSWFSHPTVYVVGLVCETAATAITTALILGYNLPFTTTTPFKTVSFAQLCAITTLASMIIYVAVVLVDYVIRTRNRMRNEKEKRYLAQFQYNTLKQQVNPHFLFNSLNILNGLIVENKNSEASEYTRRLAALYRYMLHNEDEPVVRLQEELAFVEKYIDLLKVRFSDGFSIEYRIDEASLNSCVIPCSIQILIENAFKHNVVRIDSPLMIVVGANSDCVWVQNNVQPKLSAEQSSGVGLKNMSKQYRNMVGRDIVIKKNDKEYYVELPLI